MAFDIQNLLFLQPITGATINRVVLSPKFRTLLYMTASFTMCFATLVYLARNAFAVALRKAFVVTFYFSGLIYAVQCDIVWTSWLITDTKAYAGLTTHEKLIRMKDGGGALYAFAHSARNAIHGDYVLFSSNGLVANRAEYFLLPFRRREHADYIVVWNDSSAVYNQAARTFTRGALKINHVEPIYFFAGDAYVLRRMP